MKPQSTRADPTRDKVAPGAEPDALAENGTSSRPESVAGQTHAEVSSARRGLRSIARAILWPARRFFDPRFDGVSDHVSAEAHATREHIAALTADQQNVQLREQAIQLEDLRRFVVTGRDANIDAATFVGETLRDLEERIADLQEAIEREPDSASLSGDAVTDLDAESARFLNHAVGHTGFAAQRGLWFNPPVSLSYGPQDVRPENVNERVVELPYVLRATAGLAPEARILDVGAAESTLALSLASLGFAVVALDPRGYPLAHPNLRVEARAIGAWETDETFDAVFCVSTIEHLGAGEYGEPREPGADEWALARIHDLTKPGGTLVLTAPLGEGGYERPRLEELLGNWDMTDFTVVAQMSDTTWAPGEGGGSAPASVALITATRRS
jgi:hypothetical protein